MDCIEIMVILTDTLYETSSSPMRGRISLITNCYQKTEEKEEIYQQDAMTKK